MSQLIPIMICIPEDPIDDTGRLTLDQVMAWCLQVDKQLPECWKRPVTQEQWHYVIASQWVNVCWNQQAWEIKGIAMEHFIVFIDGWNFFFHKYSVTGITGICLYV